MCSETLTANASWEPFDTRFSALVYRLQVYRETFEWEIELQRGRHNERQVQTQLSEQGKDESQQSQQVQQHLEDLRLANDRKEVRITDRYDEIEKKLSTQTWKESPSKLQIQDDVLMST